MASKLSPLPSLEVDPILILIPTYLTSDPILCDRCGAGSNIEIEGQPIIGWAILPNISAATDLGVWDLSLSLPCNIDAPNSDAPIMTMTCQPECRSRLLYVVDCTDCFLLIV